MEEFRKRFQSRLGIATLATIPLAVLIFGPLVAIECVVALLWTVRPATTDIVELVFIGGYIVALKKWAPDVLRTTWRLFLNGLIP